MTNDENTLSNKLKGFEDLFEHYMGNKEAREKKKGIRDKVSKLDDFSMTYNFLEGEDLRLKQLDVFFSTKIPNLVELPQTEKLIEIQKRKLDALEDRLIKKLERDNSPFQTQQKYLWNKHFGKF